MSSDPTSQLLNYFKQLVKQLDSKFGTLEKQLDKIEANLDNLRTYDERFQSQVTAELKEIKSSLSQAKSQDFSFLEGITQSGSSVAPQTTVSKPIPTSSPSFNAPPSPIGPPPLDQYKSATKGPQTGFAAPPPSPMPAPIREEKPSKPSKKLESQYGGMKETPILEALKEESLGDESYFEIQAKKKKVQKQTLRMYLEKLEKVVKTSLPIAEENLSNGDNQGFVDKGLTVVHGIIEFLFVAYRLEFPDASLDYYAKAKNLSGQGLFKDVSLLEKLESIYNQIERDEKPVLARPLLRGFNERILKLYEDFLSKSSDAFTRL